MIVPHTDIIPYCDVLFRRHMHRRIPAVSEALGDMAGVAPVRLYTLSASWTKHRRRSEDHTFYIHTYKSVIKAEAQAPGFISCDEAAAVFAAFAQSFDILLDVDRLCRNFDLGKIPALRTAIWFKSAKTETLAMDIHSDIDYSAHGDLFFVYVVIPCFGVVATV